MRSHRMFITLVLSLFILSAAGGGQPPSGLGTTVRPIMMRS